MYTLATLYFYFFCICYLILFDFLKHYLFLNAIRRLRRWQRKFLMLEKNSDISVLDRISPVGTPCTCTYDMNG